MSDLGNATLCPICSTPFHQPPTGRPRIYCKRTCRELAYQDNRARRKMTASQSAVPSFVNGDTGPGALDGVSDGETS